MTDRSWIQRHRPCCPRPDQLKGVPETKKIRNPRRTCCIALLADAEGCYDRHDGSVRRNPAIFPAPFQPLDKDQEKSLCCRHSAGAGVCGTRIVRDLALAWQARGERIQEDCEVQTGDPADPESQEAAERFIEKSPNRVGRAAVSAGEFSKPVAREMRRVQGVRPDPPGGIWGASARPLKVGIETRGPDPIVS
jgi:hypothetical protein